MRSNKEIEYIYDKFHKLVTYLCYKKLRGNHFLEETEVLSEGFFAFTQVINSEKFNPDSENAKGYVSSSVVRRLNTLIGKKINKFNHEVQDGEIYNYLNKLNKYIRHNDLDREHDIQHVSLVLNSAKKLSDLQRKVIDLKYYQGLTKSQISRKLNMTRQCVYQIEKTALREIKIANLVMNG